MSWEDSKLKSLHFKRNNGPSLSGRYFSTSNVMFAFQLVFICEENLL